MDDEVASSSGGPAQPKPMNTLYGSAAAMQHAETETRVFDIVGMTCEVCVGRAKVSRRTFQFAVQAWSAPETRLSHRALCRVTIGSPVLKQWCTAAFDCNS